MKNDIDFATAPTVPAMNGVVIPPQARPTIEFDMNKRLLSKKTPGSFYIIVRPVEEKF